MPTYEYKCTGCNHRFETFQKITDDPITECPECKGVVKKLISGGMVPIFKGSGFYETDYKKGKTEKSNAPKTETTTPVKTTKESKTDTKNTAA
ncbi:MAG: zinc ribbon domain-containing protein [Melioribacteraceae bacterium]|nr:zinc ribbon domain-containing protein [Melioribacteraceae bacterium]MCF8264043.1 zinc ribbon domain-containing protein [Melioribacteraceae bacterium]MCF8411855.1 zinc ribbon domain-containing protein [Melioribacteraceae bacterium]